MTDQRTGEPGAGGAGTSSGATSSGTAHAAVPPATVPPQYEPALAADERYERLAALGEQQGAKDIHGDTILATAARQAWPAVLAGGLGMIAVGVILLVWPHASLTVVAILVGAALVVSGLVRLWEGLTASNQSGGMRAAYVVIGLLAILAGLYCLRHHALSLFIVAFLVGVYFIVHGVADIGIALSARVPGRGVRGVLGVFSLAAGIIIVVWPAVTLVLLLTIVAAWLIFYGLLLAGLAFGLRRAGRTG